MADNHAWSGCAAARNYSVSVSPVNINAVLQNGAGRAQTQRTREHRRAVNGLDQTQRNLSLESICLSDSACMRASGAAVWLCAREVFRDTSLRCVCSDPLTLLGHMHEFVP